MAEGHRERLRKRMMEENIDEIPEYAVLEMYLHSLIPRRDTGDVARELLREFGNLARVVDAPLEELTKISGVGEPTAAQIKMIPYYYRRYLDAKRDGNLMFSDPFAAGDYLVEKFVGATREQVYALCMDSGFRVLCCKRIAEGDVSMVPIQIRSIIQLVIQFNAARVVIAHNHLGGNALPSADDLAVTNRLYTALECMGARLDDHLIVADGDYVSLAQSGKLHY